MAVRIRIVHCLVCDTQKEIPYFEGNPDNDFALKAVIAEHDKIPNGSQHVGQFYAVNEADWRNPATRKAIIAEVEQKSGKTTGLDPDFYAAQANFTDDALRCFQAHNRNILCPDYRSDAKRIYPDTADDRKEAGLPTKNRPNRWLCDYCPVDSVVKSAARKAAL